MFFLYRKINQFQSKFFCKKGTEKIDIFFRISQKNNIKTIQRFDDEKYLF